MLDVSGVANRSHNQDLVLDGRFAGWFYRIFFKRLFDMIGAVVFTVFFAPFIAVIAIMVSMDGGPVFFKHKRVGRSGREFDCYKFRSMVPNAEQVLQELLDNDPAARAEWNRDRKLERDPRITPVGYFLRKTSLDELPQLWNVLIGDMSLVGPRPVPEDELQRYGMHRAAYLAVRPGMTGLWQVSGRNAISYDDRVRLDCEYCRTIAFRRDLVLLLRTARVMIDRDGR